MGIFEQLGRKTPQNALPANPMQMMQKLRSDPVGFLRQSGMNIPAGMNDPQQIINHLMQSGQLPQGRLQQAMQMAQMMRK